MRKRNVRLRLWIASLILGSVISILLTLIMSSAQLGFWLPGIQPGFLLAWLVATLRRETPGGSVAVALITLGNAAFYIWLSLRVIGADIISRGRLGRTLIR